MKIEGERLIFSTGKELYPNNGIIGLSPKLEVYEGYDGPIWYPEIGEFDDTQTLTPLELIELGLYMSERWLDFTMKITKEQAKGGDDLS